MSWSCRLCGGEGVEPTRARELVLPGRGEDSPRFRFGLRGPTTNRLAVANDAGPAAFARVAISVCNRMIVNCFG